MFNTYKSWSVDVIWHTWNIRSDTVNHHTFTSAEHGYHTRSGNSASYSRLREIYICQLNWWDFHHLSQACSTTYGSIVCIVPTHSHIHHHHHRKNYMYWQLVRCGCSALWIWDATSQRNGRKDACHRLQTCSNYALYITANDDVCYL